MPDPGDDEGAGPDPYEGPDVEWDESVDEGGELGAGWRVDVGEPSDGDPRGAYGEGGDSQFGVEFEAANGSALRIEAMLAGVGLRVDPHILGGQRGR